MLRIQGLGKFCRATGKLGARSSCMVGCMVLRRNPRMLVSVVMGDVYLVGFSTMIEPLKDLGFEVIWAANFKNLVDDPNKIPCRTYQVDFHSNPLHPGNFIAYQQLASLLRNERIDLLHCNTPIGGLLGRLCARQARIHPVIYTAHGFHFFQALLS